MFKELMKTLGKELTLMAAKEIKRKMYHIEQKLDPKPVKRSVKSNEKSDGAEVYDIKTGIRIA